MAGSIVDYLNSKGQDSSITARTKLAGQYGIQNYAGTAEQNTQLLGYLQNNQPSQPTLPSDNAGLQNVLNQAAKDVQNLTSQVQSITNPVPANTIKPVTAPTLPVATAPSIQAGYLGSVQTNLETTRK